MEIFLWNPNQKTLKEFNDEILHACLHKKENDYTFVLAQVQTIKDHLMILFNEAYEYPHIPYLGKMFASVQDFTMIEQEKFESALQDWLTKLQKEHENAVLTNLQWVHVRDQIYGVAILTIFDEQILESLFGDEDEEASKEESDEEDEDEEGGYRA